MKLWILISGQRALPKGRLDAAAFDSLAAKLLEGFEAPEGLHPMKQGERRLLVSPQPAARQSAALLVPDGTAEDESLLDELPLRAFGGGALPGWLWLHRAARRAESRKEAAQRAETLLDRLGEEERDCILVTHPLFASIFMDRARLRGFAAQRSGLGAVRPWERILLSRRNEHCGGCQHNCLLSNPGCPIGRDKAARNSG